MIYSVIKASTLPSPLSPQTVYLISSDPDLAEVYISDDGLSASLLITEVVGAQKLLSTLIDTIWVTQNYTDLKDIAPEVANNIILVLSSTQDPTGWVGAVIYVYHLSLELWYRLTSIPVFTEANLDKLGETLDGQLTYHGQTIKIHWDTIDW